MTRLLKLLNMLLCRMSGMAEGNVYTHWPPLVQKTRSLPAVGLPVPSMEEPAEPDATSLWADSLSIYCIFAACAAPLLHLEGKRGLSCRPLYALCTAALTGWPCWRCTGLLEARLCNATSLARKSVHHISINTGAGPLRRRDAS